MVRVGVFDHYGWAVAVTTDERHRVVDRRRLELLEPGLPNAPIHHESHALDTAATLALVAEVRASSVRATTASLDALAADLGSPVASLSLRAWKDSDFPIDVEVQKRSPYEARVDAIRYRQVLVEVAEGRGWPVVFYDFKHVLAEATELLGDLAHEVLEAPRATLGPPWTKDHRLAVAATVVAR